MQDDLHKLYEWSNKWLLPFNIDKCSILHYVKHNNIYNYCLNNYWIIVDCFIKDLGVTFQDDLKLGEHIKKMVLNANSNLGSIRKIFHNLSKENFIVLYKSFVRPILEYCCTTWSSHVSERNIYKIQRRVTKLVKSVTNLPYCDRLKMLDLTTLYYIRLRADVILVYRIINKIEKLELSNCSHFNTRHSRYNSVRLIQPIALTVTRQNSFSHRVVNSWNDLREDVVLADF